jgi:WD40 repeat protein
MPSGAFVCALAFSPTTNLLAGGYHYYDNPNRAVTLWDARSGELRGQLANSASAVRALFFTSDGRELVAFNRDGSIRNWCMADYAELRYFQGSRQWTDAIGLLPDNHTLAITDRGALRLFDLTASNRPSVHVKLATAFSPARLPELKPKDFKTETLDTRAMCRFTCAFTPDSRGFITSDPNGPLAFWSTWPFARKEKLIALGSNHWGVALSPDGHWLATGHAPPGKVTIWDWPACSIVTNLDVPFDFFGMLHFCGSGHFLVSSVFDNRARINTKLWRAGDWTETPVAFVFG